MLAAPVLALKLPTLVLLNMSDLMETRGGVVDSLALAQELGVRWRRFPRARAGYGCHRALPGAEGRAERDGAGGSTGAAGAAGDGQCALVPPVGDGGKYADALQGAAVAGVDAQAGWCAAGTGERAGDFPAGGYVGVPGGVLGGAAVQRLVAERVERRGRCLGRAPAPAVVGFPTD